MARFLIPIVFAFSTFVRAEDSLWRDNKPTPEQPFPGRVLAVEAAPSDGDKSATASVVKPDPWTTSEYSVLAVDGRFAAYIGITPVVIDARLRDKNPKSYLEAIECFGPAFTSRASSSGTWEWHFDDGMIYRVQPCWSGPLSKAISLNLEKTYRRIIEAKEPK